MPASLATMTILDLGPHLIGFYDGRVPGARFYGPEPNWIDDSGYGFGICSYAIVNGRDAIVYDTHLSLVHASAIRSTLEARGVRTIRVVLSHWHLDHIAGNAAFADCEIIALDKTLALMTQHKTAIERATFEGPPAIAPLVLPTTTFSGDQALDVAGLQVELRPLDIHSRDGVAIYLPHDGTLLAGDTLEDTVTYVDEPDRLANHLDDLARMATWNFTRILPNHGSTEKIAAAGYDRTLISATQVYVEKLLRAADDEALQTQDLRTFLTEPLHKGWVTYFAPYEDLHRGNVENVVAAMGKA
jgi:cyclase